jgi:NDP-sugar pyrophosphorylase family protein
MTRMQIVIPMSGFGERFRQAGYAVPKPLIEIDGKPIIAHVIDMFPGETDFLFICNGEHLEHPDYRMAEILRSYCPSGRIASVAPHKLGPIHAVRQVAHLLDPARPVVVNYCDFTCYWDWQEFKQFVAANACDGAVPAYRGFHPHTLGSTNYAYMLEQDGWVLGIQEKQPYTTNRMQEYASSGTYYFSSAALMGAVFDETVARELQVGGEYYVSLAYVPLLESGRRVAVYPLQHFMQWGTPQDVAEYRRWSDAFRALAQAPSDRGQPAGSLVIPMAGMGQRFADEGYTVIKPLIPVSGQPMVAQAVAELPAARQHSFVLRADMPGHADIGQTLAATYPGAVITTVPGVTQGQACSALLGLDALGDAAGPVTFGACDYGALFDPAALKALLEDPEVDVIVWGVRGHPNAVRHPQMFGWIDAVDGHIKRISVKTPLASPQTDPTVLGTFTFKRQLDCRAAVARLLQRDGRINGEFYLDSCINDALELGLRCHLFEVDHYLSWGTPNDLRTFEYWQSCFHKWDSHPYRLELDARVPKAQVAELAQQTHRFTP